ncbi:MAG TPA: pilus assembly protein TadG-related protein [Bryobacterales bacterium]|nr:pilus assembly protein TadG-related protein [Bryobacterales bacterium]
MRCAGGISMRSGRRSWEAGQALVITMVLLVFVLFAFLGFAVDLGRLYLIKGELHTAAETFALAAANQLIGTNSADTAAATAISTAQNADDSGDNRYNFAGTQIGSSGHLTSEIEDPQIFSTYNDATSGDSGATSDAASARYARIIVRADAPLTFWQFLPVARSGITSIETSAVAGISAPLCTVCGAPPLAIVQRDPNDATDFGFLQGQKYTFYIQCTGAPPTALAGAPSDIQYTLLNRALEDSSDPDQQIFELLAGGIPAPSFPVSGDSNLACPTIGTTELRLPTVSVAACTAAQRGTDARDALCGLNARLDPAPNPACSPITDVDTLIQSFPPDTDIDSHDDYTDYAGNGRRILTVAIVDTIPFAVTGTMNVLGFRQFLLEPNPDATELNPIDPVGRFVALYIGSPAPVPQGQFGACGVTTGPGKVVLHQ